MPARIAYAARKAERNKVDNVTFEIASAEDYPFEPQSFDVVLLLSILSKLGDASAVLDRALTATRRQVIIRTGHRGRKSAKRGIDLASIVSAVEKSNFESAVFKGRRTTVIIGLRRGTDARLKDVPCDFEPY